MYQGVIDQGMGKEKKVKKIKKAKTKISKKGYDTVNLNLRSTSSLTAEDD